MEERVEGAGTLVDRHYTWGMRDRWDLLRRKRSTGSSSLNEVRFCLRDYLDPVATAGADGLVTERFGYDAFGEARFTHASFEVADQSLQGWEFLFHGEFQDPGTGLYNYGYRFYSAPLGRWLSRDPLGESLGYDLYVYGYNEPLEVVDFLGRNPDWIIPPSSMGMAYTMQHQQIFEQQKRDSERLFFHELDIHGSLEVSWDIEESGTASSSITYSEDLGPDDPKCCKTIRFIQIVSGNIGFFANSFWTSWQLDDSNSFLDGWSREPGSPKPYVPNQSSQIRGKANTWDAPRAASGGGKVDLETCAVCVDNGKVLGCILWSSDRRDPEHPNLVPSSGSYPANKPSVVMQSFMKHLDFPVP